VTALLCPLSGRRKGIFYGRLPETRTSPRSAGLGFGPGWRSRYTKGSQAAGWVCLHSPIARLCWRKPRTDERKLALESEDKFGAKEMAQVCDVCGKGPQFGNNISHAHNVTKRRWNVNLQAVKALVNGAPKRIRVCTSCIKSGKVQKG